VFRSLQMRLVALYVFVAGLLVLIVGAAIGAFALSTFAAATNATVAEVAREAPGVAQRALAQEHSLKAAAQIIVRRLAAPGVRIVLVGGQGGQFVRVASSPDVTLSSQFPFGLNVVLGLNHPRIDIPGGQIVISPDPEPLEQIFNEVCLAMLPVGLLVAVLAFLLGRYITGQALRPLVETTQSLRRFASGDFTPHPIAVPEDNEIGELVTAYNGAVAQVSAAFEERGKADQEMRQFIADASHELRTPLTVIMGFIDVLRRRTSTEPAMAARIYETMYVESRRMKVLVDKLIVLARLENVVENLNEEIDLADLAERVVASVATLETPSRIALQTRRGVMVIANENELFDAVRNLVENALKYAPGSPIEVAVLGEGDHAVVEVTDHGPGLTPEEQEHVFDRFYRGSSRGKTEGFGLGLAISKRVVERAGGTITLRSAPGEGCRFTISLRRIAAVRAAS